MFAKFSQSRSRVSRPLLGPLYKTLLRHYAKWVLKHNRLEIGIAQIFKSTRKLWSLCWFLNVNENKEKALVGDFSVIVKYPWRFVWSSSRYVDIRDNQDTVNVFSRCENCELLGTLGQHWTITVHMWWCDTVILTPSRVSLGTGGWWHQAPALRLLSPLWWL